MNIDIRDVEAVSALRPLEVAAYLRAQGWNQHESDTGHASIWTISRGDDEFEVLLPLRPEIRDFALRMGDALRTISVAEGRSQAELYSDLLTSAADVVRIRVDALDLQDGTVPIEVNAQLAQRVRDLILAAACSATEHRAVWHKRKPNQAIEHVRKVRIGQTERGSYVVTVISRVSPLLQIADSEAFEGQEPFERRVTRTLATSLKELDRAAEQAAITGAFASFDTAVSSGVSANLCDAVAGLWGEEDRLRQLDISFSWSPGRPAESSVPRRVLFTSDRIPVIREAGRIMRERAPVRDFELDGAVVRLERPVGQPTGRVTIMGQIEDKPRRVTLELGDPDYHKAVQAHDQQTALSCCGELHREGRGYVLKEPREIAIDTD